MVKIRPLSQTDSITELTTLLHQAYARLGAMGLNYTAVDQTPEITAKRLSGGTCLIADVGGEMEGTVVVQPTYDTNHCEYFTKPGVACAHQFAVDPLHQGNGIGRQLLGAAEDWARREGFTELAIDTAEQATHLLGLYDHLGYQQVSWVHWPGKVYSSMVLSKVLG